MRRFSIANLLGLVAVIALGFAAVRSASDFWLGATFLLTIGLLCAGVLGAVVERGHGVWWLGFAVFGWVYFALGFEPSLSRLTAMPSSSLARQVFSASNRFSGQVSAGSTSLANLRIGPDGRPIGPDGRPIGLTMQEYAQRYGNAAEIGRWLMVLAFARIGAAVSCLFTKGLGPWRRRGGEASAPVSA